MNTKDLKGLMEAYSEVYAPQEVDEAVKGADPEMRRAASVERRAGDKPLPKSEGEKFAKFKASQISYIDKKTKGKYIHGMTRENFDIFDMVLEFLQAEGYAETLEEAQWMMANVLDKETIDMIIGEGMTMKDFKKQRSRQKQKEKRAAEKTSPTRRANMSSYERAVRHRVSVDPDYDRDHEERDYPGGVTKNPKKIRKAKALGELG